MNLSLIWSDWNQASMWTLKTVKIVDRKILIKCRNLWGNKLTHSLFRIKFRIIRMVMIINLFRINLYLYTMLQERSWCIEKV